MVYKKEQGSEDRRKQNRIRYLKIITGGFEMKTTTERIVEKFPFVQDVLSIEALSEEEIKSYNLVEKTFLQLALFFEYPEEMKFDLQLLYKNLDKDSLPFALELVVMYFKKDNLLIQKPTYSVLHEGDQYFAI